MHFVENSLLGQAHQHRLTSLSYRPPRSNSIKLKFIFDFASPWSYMGFTQMKRIALKYNIFIEFVPVLLGGIIKTFTPNYLTKPRSAASRNYAFKDLKDWQKWHDVPFTFNSKFPLRSIQLLRLALVFERRFKLQNISVQDGDEKPLWNIDPDIIQQLFNPCWATNKNIADPKEIMKVLLNCNVNVDILRKTNDKDIKDKLRKNTEWAIQNGIFGVPTYNISTQPKVFIWGQDRLNIVEDMICGWRVPTNVTAKL